MPNGGWLDGCLNVLAGLEVLRRIAAKGTPPVTVRLVDWADEEGARFGRSLFGSSAVAGTMNPEDLTPPEGPRRHQAARCAGPAWRRPRPGSKRRGQQLANAAAYLELHIEQGPVLESLDLPLGVVLGTFGVERHRITWRGQAAHAGSTPMDKRRDALAGAAKLALEIREIARTHRRRRGLHQWRGGLQAGDCDLGGRDGRATARPAPPERREAGRAAGAGQAGQPALCRGGEHRGRVGADLEDRADPVPP